MAVGALALLGTTAPAGAADDGVLYRHTSATAQCSDFMGGYVALGSPSSVTANYPAGATLGLEIDASGTGSGLDGSPSDVSFALNPAGESGTVTTPGFGGTAPTFPRTLLFRFTLSVGGVPTYQQTVSVTCESDAGPGSVEILGENLFETSDAPAADPAAVIEATLRFTG
jgi:hypothetical protein